MVRASLSALVLLLSASALASAQGSSLAAPPTTIEVEFARADLTTKVSLFTAIAEAGNRGVDTLLDKAFGRPDGTGGRRAAARFARLWLVNLPIAALAHSAAHDSGHFARLDEIARGSRSVDVTHWPWPIPLVGTVEHTSVPIDDPFDALAVTGGGEQGSIVMRSRLADKIYASGRADYSDWLMLGYASLDFPVYGWTDLRPANFRDEGAPFSGMPADFRQYVFLQAEIGRRFDLATYRRYARDIRRSASLNLLDFALWSAFARTARYVATGERSMTAPAIRVGGFGVIPGAYATLGSIGLERGVDVRVVSPQYLARISLRRTSVPSRGERWGGGIALRSRRHSGLRPEAQLDIWRRLEGETGARVEAGFRRALREGPWPVDGGLRLGYKTEGYLSDAPSRRGLLAAVTASVGF